MLVILSTACSRRFSTEPKVARCLFIFSMTVSNVPMALLALVCVSTSDLETSSVSVTKFPKSTVIVSLAVPAATAA